MTELSYRVDSDDPEIQAIEVVLYATRQLERKVQLRVLNYVLERANGADHDD